MARDNRFIYETGFVTYNRMMSVSCQSPGIAMKEMSITIRKIAKDLNLAVSTVSKAMSDSYEISDQTKQRILDYAARMNYVPNAYAGSLKNRKTKNIAVVVPEVADSFFSNSINGIESVAVSRGYHVLIYLTHENLQRESSILTELRGGRVDGILLSVSSNQRKTPIHKELIRRVPLVFFDRICDSVDAPAVITDDFASSYKATVHLLSKGCRNVAFLSFTDGLSIIQERKAGFLSALNDAGLSYGLHNIVRCSEIEEENYHVLSDLFERIPKVDGVVASVEKLAVQTYRICNQRKITIPDDMRVIAFSNTQTADLFSPSLSTVTQPAFDMGRTAATMLFSMLEGKRQIDSAPIVLPSCIHERDSTQ